MTTPPTNTTLVEKPILDTLTGQYGYRAIHPAEHPSLRARENQVLFKPLLIDALVRINDIPASTAEAVFNDIDLGVTVVVEDLDAPPHDIHGSATSPWSGNS